MAIRVTVAVSEAISVEEASRHGLIELFLHLQVQPMRLRVSNMGMRSDSFHHYRHRRGDVFDRRGRHGDDGLLDGGVDHGVHGGRDVSDRGLGDARYGLLHSRVARENGDIRLGHNLELHPGNFAKHHRHLLVALLHDDLQTPVPVAQIVVQIQAALLPSFAVGSLALGYKAQTLQLNVPARLGKAAVTPA